MPSLERDKSLNLLAWENLIPGTWRQGIHPSRGSRGRDLGAGWKKALDSLRSRGLDRKSVV